MHLPSGPLWRRAYRRCGLVAMFAQGGLIKIIFTAENRITYKVVGTTFGEIQNALRIRGVTHVVF